MLRTALYWGLGGLIAGPVAVYLLILLVLYTDANCRAGVVENCNLDAGLNLVEGAIAGFIALFCISLGRSIVRRAREE